MGLKRFNFKGKAVFLDDYFNVSADKEQDEHLGVLQVRQDRDEFYIASKAKRTKEALKDVFEKKIFDETKALFIKVLQAAIKKKEDKMFAPYEPVRALPTPVVPVSAPVLDPRRIVMSDRGGVTVKLIRAGKLLTASELEELEERREAAARLRYDKEEREAEQAYYMAAE